MADTLLEKPKGMNTIQNTEKSTGEWMNSLIHLTI